MVADHRPLHVGRSARVWLVLLGLNVACAIPDPLPEPDAGISSDAAVRVDGDADGDAGLVDAGVGAGDVGAQPEPDAGLVEPPVDAGLVPTEDDAARVVAFELPQTMECGASQQGHVVMMNTGRATWTRVGEYKLGAVDDVDPFRRDNRVYLDENERVETGQTHRFNFRLLAPDEPGRYTTDWRMVHDGVTWFGESVERVIDVQCEDPVEPQRPLPNRYNLVRELAERHPRLLANSCQDEGGTWEFLDLVVDRLRESDTRWGYNWKRGRVGDPSQDVVDYHYGDDRREGSTQVYIIDVIVGHCGDNPHAGWGDQTEETRRQGTIGRWTSRGRFPSD